MEVKEKKKLEQALKLMAKSSLIVFIGVALSKIFMYLYRIIVARHYGPEVYGLFSLAVMILTWFTAFFSLGLSEGLLRYVSLYRGRKDFKKIKHLLKISMRVTLFSGILAGIILFFLAGFISLNFFHNEKLIIFLKIFAIFIPLALFSKIFLSVLRAFEKISIYSFILNILQNGFILFSLILFIFLGLSKTNPIIFSYCSGFLIALIASYGFCRYKLPIIFGKYLLKNKIKEQTTRSLISYSWPLMFFGIITSIFFWVDSFVIGYFKGAIHVGFYNAAFPIVALLGVAPDLFMQLFLPLITREYSRKNFEIIKQLSKQVGKWIIILNIPIFLIMFIFPEAVINILFGKEYLIAKDALRILSVGGILSSFVALASSLLQMAGKSKLMLINLIIATSINFFLNIMLVPTYGIVGAAIATSFVWVLWAITLLLEVNYYTKILPFKRKLLRILIISLIPTLLIIYIRRFFPTNLFSMIILGSSFLLLYLFLILTTGCLDENDMLIIKAIKKKILKTKNEN